MSDAAVVGTSLRRMKPSAKRSAPAAPRWVCVLPGSNPGGPPRSGLVIGNDPVRN